MKLIAGFFVAVALAGGVRPALAQTDSAALSVMTRNQYIGGDLMPVAAAPDIPSFLAAARALLTEIALNNFPERARVLAREIAERRPDVVAFQEVYDLKLNGLNGAPPFVDHLAATMSGLQAEGADYAVVASVRDMAITVPVDLDGNGEPESLVSVTDRDVLLARRDLVDAGLVSAVPLSSYACARPSPDHGPGCNFSTYASTTTPAGTLALERGFVAIDVTVGDRTFRVVNTHLEVENLDPSNPLSPLIQSAQAAELKATIDATSDGCSVILVGDLNSTPDDPLFPDPHAGPFVRPAPQFARGVDLFNAPTAGGPYSDPWLLRPGDPAGFTCCQADLGASDFSVSERKDLVFSRDVPVSVKENLVGTDIVDKTVSGLWASDHAGVWARLKF